MMTWDVLLGGLKGGTVAVALFLAGYFVGSWLRNQYNAWKLRRNPPPPPEPVPLPVTEPAPPRPNAWFPINSGQIVPDVRLLARAMHAVCDRMTFDYGAAAFNREAAGEKLTAFAIFASIAGDLLTQASRDLWASELDDNFLLTPESRSRLQYREYFAREPAKDVYARILADYDAKMATLRAAEAGDEEALRCVRLTVEQMRVRHRARQVLQGLVAIQVQE